MTTAFRRIEVWLESLKPHLQWSMQYAGYSSVYISHLPENILLTLRLFVLLVHMLHTYG